MNASIKTLAIIALSLAAATVQVVSHAQVTDGVRETYAAACERNAGAFNYDEKIGCLTVAASMEEQSKAEAYVHPVTAQVANCKALAGAFNADEKAGCISAVVARHVGYCMIAGGSAMAIERAACIKVVNENAYH